MQPTDRAAADFTCLEVSALAAQPGVVHGFEWRPPHAVPEERSSSRRRWTAALAPRGRLLLLSQVHGVRVQRAPWHEQRPEGDAAACSQPGWLLGIETADCLPVLLVDPWRRQVAAAHAGWRGSAAGVAAAAVAALVELGSRPDDLLAALGPAIGPCCYEVGLELREAFQARYGSAAESFFRAGPAGRPHLDLRAANVADLLASGLRAQSVHHADHCTRCRADLFPSYRRDGPGAGRLLSFVGWSA